MASKTYTAVFIRPKTRTRLRVACAKAGRTFDEKINDLLDAEEVALKK